MVDAGLDRLLDAVKEEASQRVTATAALQDPIDMLVEAVCRSGVDRRSKFCRRSHLLTRHMRGVKKAIGKRAVGGLAPHVRGRIDMMNEDHAVRRLDVIVPDEVKPVKVKGSGV